MPPWSALGGRARVKFVCSRTAERGQRVAALVGASFSADLSSALADPEIDAVGICLPTILHRPTAERAFAAELAWASASQREARELT